MIRRVIQTGLFSMAAVALTATLAMAQSQTTKPFGGAKVNGGTVTYVAKDGKATLTLSDDFKVPTRLIRTGKSSTQMATPTSCNGSARRASVAWRRIGSTCRSRCRRTFAT
jgi:hypothetical protein